MLKTFHYQCLTVRQGTVHRAFVHYSALFLCTFSIFQCVTKYVFNFCTFSSLFSIMLAFLMLSTFRGTLSPCYIFAMLRFCHVVLFSRCTFFVLHFTMLFFFRVTLFSSCTHFMLYSFSVVFLHSCSTLSQLRTFYLAHKFIGA